MSNSTTAVIAGTLSKFFSLRMNNRLALKRTYDDWTIKQYLADKKRQRLVKSQTFDLPQHVRLGSDLAVSKFVLDYCRGKIKDENGKWLETSKSLPEKFSPTFKVTAIKARNCQLTTEAMDNFAGLEHLESLDLAGNARLDDFSCDILGRVFRNSKTLGNIDISECPSISLNGVEILFRIPSLRRIVAIKTKAAKHEDIDLFTLTAQDERQCNVFVHDDGRQFKLDELETLSRTNHKMDVKLLNPTMETIEGAK